MRVYALALAACAVVPSTVARPHRRVDTPVVSTAKSADPAKWKPLKDQLDGWVFTKNFGFTVGDASGPLFEYTHGDFSLETTKCELASTSKWPLAMMFVGLVNDGTIHSLDALANEYVPWWTKNASDPKSEITLRHLLSFTSGFGEGTPGQVKQVFLFGWFVAASLFGALPVRAALFRRQL